MPSTPYHHPMTPRRQVSNEDVLPFPANNRWERELPISATKDNRQGRMGHSEDKYEEVRYQFDERADK